MVNPRISTQLIIRLSVAILLPMALILTAFGIYLRFSTEAQAVDVYKITLESEALRIRTFLEAPGTHFRLLAKDAAGPQDWALLEERLSNLKSEFSYLEYLEVLDPRGKVLFSLPDIPELRGVNRISLDHISTALKTRTTVYSNSFLSVETGGAAVAFAHPFSDFVIHGHLSMGKLGLGLTESSGDLLKKHHFTLTDSRGTLLFDQDMDRVYRKETFQPFRDTINQEAEIKVLWDKVEDTLILGTSLEPLGWYLFLQGRSEDVFRTTVPFHLLFLVLLFCTLTGVILFSVLSARQAAGYLRALGQELKGMAEGRQGHFTPAFRWKEIQQVSGAMEDLTTTIRTREEEFRRQMDELDSKKAELERFISTISHDLKSPLITIKGFLGHLKVDWAQDREDRFQEDVVRIGHAADRMQELLEDLLHLSLTTEAGERIQTFKMHSAFRSALENLATPLPPGSLKYPPDYWPEVRGDFGRITEVWQCLLENSQKFPGSHPLEVEAGWLQTEEVIYFLKDNGLGIPPVYQKKIFNLFEKIDPSSPGSGIGLALAKRIVEQHHGRIWVESSGDGAGSVFYFTLPQPSAPY